MEKSPPLQGEHMNQKQGKEKKERKRKRKKEINQVFARA
jgi:hypothetical protein